MPVFVGCSSSISGAAAAHEGEIYTLSLSTPNTDHRGPLGPSKAACACRVSVRINDKAVNVCMITQARLENSAGTVYSDALHLKLTLLLQL